jgi:hypothetical protein
MVTSVMRLFRLCHPVRRWCLLLTARHRKVPLLTCSHRFDRWMSKRRFQNLALWDCRHPAKDLFTESPYLSQMAPPQASVPVHSSPPQYFMSQTAQYQTPVQSAAFVYQTPPYQPIPYGQTPCVHPASYNHTPTQQPYPPQPPQASSSPPAWSGSSGLPPRSPVLPTQASLSSASSTGYTPHPPAYPSPYGHPGAAHPHTPFHPTVVPQQHQFAMQPPPSVPQASPPPSQEFLAQVEAIQANLKVVGTRYRELIATLREADVSVVDPDVVSDLKEVGSGFIKWFLVLFL